MAQRVPSIGPAHMNIFNYRAMSLTLKDVKSTWVDKTEPWTNYTGKKSNKWGEDISLLCLLSPGSLVHMKVL